jgi:SAM-dependent methyltransferase
MTPAAALSVLVDRASVRYRSSGKFAYYFARGKLATDPVFATLLARKLLPDAPRLLDLGCGQGLLAAWLESARALFDEGRWPVNWPAPPRPIWFRGFEIDAHEVRRAQLAVGNIALIQQSDLRALELQGADAVMILDVLHYLEPDDQVCLLERTHSALNEDGKLLVRVGNAAGGIRFAWSRWVDAAIWRLRGRGRTRLCFRTLEGWIALLASTGFVVEQVPMIGARSFANVLLLATRAAGIPARAQGTDNPQ